MGSHADKGIFALLKRFALTDIQNEADAGVAVFDAGHSNQDRDSSSTFVEHDRFLWSVGAAPLTCLLHQRTQMRGRERGTTRASFHFCLPFCLRVAQPIQESLIDFLQRPGPICQKNADQIGGKKLLGLICEQALLRNITGDA